MFVIQIYGMTALIGAAIRGHTPVVEELLKAKANPDVQDKVTSTVCAC